MKKEYDLKKMKVKRRGIMPELQAKEASSSKIRITISLDKDLVDFFKSNASKPGAFPYQTQINQALRQIIEESQTGNQADIEELKTQLLHDVTFIRELSKKVNHRQARK